MTTYDPDQLARIETMLQQLHHHLGVGKRPAGAAPAGGCGDLDPDIDGPRGNPEVRFVPKRWEGQNFKGRTYSECDPEFLDMLAETLDYFARKNDEQGATDRNGGPKSKWDRLDASRARAHAQRNRERQGTGGHRPKAAAKPAAAAENPWGADPGGGFGDEQDDDSIPF